MSALLAGTLGATKSTPTQSQADANANAVNEAVGTSNEQQVDTNTAELWQIGYQIEALDISDSTHFLLFLIRTL
jgi:hypothetical protein